ncbi:hypothetical protein [Paenibacillus sp. HB172176]|uniref:hypothetical protein n=1 Tax=Paenibacillus sp. HB172176 TaxID=2493690 RepID=UPI00143BC260|nr:hypothetical protein [Paenibacillus sp. HB172176]
MDQLIISEEDMVLETEEFSKVYPILMNEIDHIERVRGKLNDFQLMLAISRAKDSMAILSWDRRQTVNAILEKYAQLYRESGREAADAWVDETFGFILRLSEDEEAEADSLVPRNAEMAAKELEDARESEASSRIARRKQEISGLITVKETELLQLYREFYKLSKYTT